MAPITKSELKDMQSLQTKKGRREKKMYLAEGVRLLEEAHRHKAALDHVLYSAHLLSERGQRLVSRFERARVRVSAVSARQMQTIAGTRTSQGIVGVCSQLPDDDAELFHRRLRRLLLCDNISDPGNLGTLMRSAAAFGFEALLLCGATADGYAPKVVRASAGAVFALRQARSTVARAVELAEQARVPLAAGDINGRPLTVALERQLGKQPLILAIGSEAEGLSPEISKQAQWRLKLEHRPAVESLNAAVAGSIMMSRIYQTSRR